MFQDDTTGLRFGNFEVLVRPNGSIHELGRGGFGRTLLARHALLNTRVALKMIDERYARDESARAKFLKEAREQARLIHPGIARITDCGQVDGQLYYAVELCPDGNLSELVAKAGPLNVADTFHLLLQAAEALEYSHRKGVVHLDVKPSNVMLVFDKEGVPQVKLIDFGLVQQPVPEAAPIAHDGQPLFSAAFASPEQIRSKPADGRSDIFSLGMTGWYLLTGRNPLEGSAEVLIQERLSAVEYEPSLPSQLTGQPRAVLARMIRKNAPDRHDNTGDLLTDLRACLSSLPRLAGGWQHRRHSSGALADRFELEKGSPSRQGTVHRAIDRDTGRRVNVTLLRSTTMSQTVAQFHKVREIMSGMEGSGLLRVLEVREFKEGWVVIEEGSGGTSLTEILRGEGALPLARYAPLVWQLGAAMDTAFSAGLTNVMLEEAIVELPPGAAKKGIEWVHAVVRMPLEAGARGSAAAQEGDVTLTGDFTRTGVGGAGVQLLARWVYFIVGGKNPPNSSLFSIKEYIAIPGLGDHGNQILARHLCGQSAPALCQDMLRPLFAAEGISWDSVGEKVRHARWATVIQESGAVVEEIESSVTAAEKLVAACEPFAAMVPEEVRKCYTAAAAVYEAAESARAHQSKLSQGLDKAAPAGQTMLGTLKDFSRSARASLDSAEAAFRDVNAAMEIAKRREEERKRRRRDLVESFAEAWRRTEAAAREIEATMAERLRIAGPGGGAAEMKDLPSRVAAFVIQVQALHEEAEAAPEPQWDQLEKRVPDARRIAADAREMARTCRSLLEIAHAEARRLEDEARRRDAVLEKVREAAREVEQCEAEAAEYVRETAAAAAELPELQEAGRRAESDGVRVAGIARELRQLLAGSTPGLAQLEQQREHAAIAAVEARELRNGLRVALQQAQKAAGDLRRRAAARAAATATLTNISAASAKVAGDALHQCANHGLVPDPESAGAESLARAAAAAREAAACRDQIAALAVQLDSRAASGLNGILEEAKRLAAECDRQAAETVRHLKEAAFYIAESERKARKEEEEARAEAAAALTTVLAQADREIKRAREAFTRAGQYAEVAAAVGAVTMASEAWSAVQSGQRQIRQWQTARPVEAASDRDFLQLLSGATKELASFADRAEQAAKAAEVAAKDAAHGAGERRQREEEARRKAEAEARRIAAAAAEEQRRQAEFAEQRRRQQEEARRKADDEARRTAAAEANRDMAVEAETPGLPQRKNAVRKAAAGKRSQAEIAEELKRIAEARKNMATEQRARPAQFRMAAIRTIDEPGPV